MLHHLTLGRNKPDGGYVTDLDWQMYCQEVLDSNFDGYTITDAVGTWKSDLEDTKIVIINTTNQDKVEDVAWLYKDMFNQEAVGHYTTSPMVQLAKQYITKHRTTYSAGMQTTTRVCITHCLTQVQDVSTIT